MKKKIISIAAAVVVATTLLTGCGAKPAASKPADVVTTASLINDASVLPQSLGKDGVWIICTLQDLKTDKELVIEGEFRDKNDPAKDLYRKLALYAQDENHKVTARYTLTAPKLTVKSPNTRIQGGTFKGDIYVEASGFNLQDATVEGNIYFASQEYKDSFVLPTEEGKAAKVTGSIEVK